MRLVQVGCHTGNDPFFDYVKAKQDEIEKVVIIDALPSSVDICEESYRANIAPENLTKLTFIRAAVVANEDHEDTVDFFVPRNEHSGDAEVKYTAFSSTDRDHLTRHRVTDVKKISVPAFTLDEVFEQQRLGEKIDRLDLDAEGLDADILLALNLERFDIPFVCFENLHVEGGVSKKDLLHQKFKDNGYRLVTLIHKANPKYGYNYDHFDWNTWALKDMNLVAEIIEYAGHKIKFEEGFSSVVEL